MLRHNFKKMKIWLNAMDLCKSIFNLIENFPKEEVYGLKSQIGRCVVSIPSNIAEGSSRSSNKDFSRFLEMSLGSIYELQTQLILANYKGFVLDDQLQKIELQIEELQKMISGFQNSLK
jgi:four helix bundle protein